LAADGKTCLISSHILTELAEMCDLVGIIEQGQLLAVGTVEEIQHGGGHDHDVALVAEKAVKLRVLSNTDELASWLSARDDLTNVISNGELVTFLHWHDTAWEADLLRE